MACCAVQDNSTAFDHEIAMSLTKCSLKEWDDLTKATSHSEAACSASCSAACSAMPHPGIPMKMKACFADYADDKTTECSDEPAENDLADYDLAEDEHVDFEAHDEMLSHQASVETEPVKYEQLKDKLPEGRRAWADFSDSDSEETASIQATCSESEEEDEGHVSARRVARSSRAAKRSNMRPDEEIKAAGAEVTTSEERAADNEDVSCWSKAGNKSRVRNNSNVTNKAEITPGANAHKGDEAKAGHRDSVKSVEKGSGKAVGKGKGNDKYSAWQGAEKGSGKAARKDTEDSIISKGNARSEAKSASKGKAESKGDSKGKGKSDGKGKGHGKDNGKGDGKGKGKSKGKGKDHSNDKDKFQCQITIGIEEESKFRVVRRLIGAGGGNMKDIHEASGARLRLRGRGSKFLEGEEQLESTDDLMLCITCDDKDGYERAYNEAIKLIEGVHKNYRSFCRTRSIDCSNLEYTVHEGYRPGSR